MKICTIAFESIHTRRYIAWLVKAGHEVHWITCDPRGNIDGSCVYDLNKYFWQISFKGSSRLKKFRLFRRMIHYFYIRKLLKEIVPDVLHLHTLYYPSYLGALTHFRPLMISPWNGDVLWTLKRPYYYKLFAKFFLKKADALTITNEIMKKVLLKYGVKKDKLNIIRWYGVDAKLFKPMRKDIRLLKELNIKDSMVVLSMRSLERLYNIDKILKSIPIVLKKVKNVTYIFAWHSASLENEMRLLVKELQVEDNVRFVGRVPYEEIPRYYSISDVGISIASPDNTPATLLEAMACGVPSVVSREKGITEFIKDGVNGEVVDPENVEEIAERTLKLLLDARKREEYGRHNRESVMEIANMDVEMGKLESLYEGLINK